MQPTSFQLQKLAKAFRALRENRGLTQVEAGELAHIPRLAVIKIEAGRETVAKVVREQDELAFHIPHVVKAIQSGMDTFSKTYHG